MSHGFRAGIASDGALAKRALADVGVSAERAQVASVRQPELRPSSSDPPRVGPHRPSAKRAVRPRPWPAWARWNDTRGERYTLGVEEEVILVDPATWSLAQSSDGVLSQLSDALMLHASAETHAGVIELKTDVHGDVSGVIAELASLRTRLGLELSTHALAAAATGTHPLTLREETELSSSPRYLLLGDSLRALVRREPTMALHVHVGVPTAEDAVRLLNGLRRSLPVLIALSANSPFWRGTDSGFASVRTVIFQSFPRTGLPRVFARYQDYVEAIGAVIDAGAVTDPSFFWWDVRLQPELGSVEVRVMDAQSSLRDVAPLVALIQSLARLELESDFSPVTPSPETLAENRFLASRDGMGAELIDTTTRRLVPIREMLAVLLAQCRPHARALGCADALDRAADLGAANGADRQRAIAARNGSLDDLVASLTSQFLAPADIFATGDFALNTLDNHSERSG